MSDDAGIEITCPHCQQRLRVPGSTAGMRIHCPDCAGVIEVPARTGISEEPPKPWSTPAAAPADTDISSEPSKPWSRPADMEDEDRPSRRSRDDDDDFADVRRRRSADAGGAVIAPAICMLIVALIGFGLSVFNVVAAVATAPPPVDPNAPPFLQEIMKGTHGVQAAVIQSVFAMLYAITILGSVQMMRRKTWGLALTVSIFSMINFASCCCILGLPFGIWSLITLVNPEVKDSFS